MSRYSQSMLGVCIAAMLAVGGAAFNPALAQEQKTTLSDPNPQLGAFNAAAPLHKLVPASVVAAKEIVTGIILGEPPSQYVDPDSKELKGFDIELLRALSKQLGVPFKVVPTEYGAFIPGLQARRFNLVAAFIADTPKRQEVVDFIDDYATMDLALAHKTTDVRINTLDDLCGRSLAIDQGHYLVPQMKAQADKCKADGKAELRIDIYRDGPASQQAVRTKRSEVIISSGATALYAVKVTNGEMKIVSGAIGKPVLVGYVVLKGNDGLRDAVKAAFAEIMRNGEYRAILTKWGLEAGALTQPYINEGPNAASIVGSR